MTNAFCASSAHVSYAPTAATHLSGSALFAS